jgi:hypothetical protein
MHLGASTLLGRLAKAEEERIDAPRCVYSPELTVARAEVEGIDAPRCVYSPWPTGQG